MTKLYGDNVPDASHTIAHEDLPVATAVKRAGGADKPPVQPAADPADNWKWSL